MVVVALAVAGVSLCVLVAWSYPRRTARLCTIDGQALKAALAGLPRDERLARFRKMTSERGWDADLADRLAIADNDRERAAAVNEALTSAEHELGAREEWPRAAFWLAAASACAASVGGFLLGVRTALLYLVPIAGVGMAACLQARRSGRRHASRQRTNIDAIVAAVLGELHERDLDLPARRRMRWRRKKG